MLLGPLNSIISDFPSIIYLFYKANYFVLRELFTDAYKLIRNKPLLVKAYT